MAKEKKVSIAIIGKTKNFTDSLTRSQKAMGKFSSIAGTLGKATVAGLGVASVAAVTLGKDLVNLGSDANEARSAFETTFGESVPKLSGFVDEFANKAGLAAHDGHESFVAFVRYYHEMVLDVPEASKYPRVTHHEASRTMRSSRQVGRYVG